MENTFRMVAKTFQGLEDVLSDELISIGAQNVNPGIRMVSFEGDLEILYKANLCCRTALRVLRPIIHFDAYDTDQLYDCVRDINWEDFMTADSTFSVDSTVNSSDFTHSKYVTYRVKDGIVDHFRDICGKRPSIRLNGADLQLNVHISDNRVTISLDSSGEPLNKRGYRVDQTEAPINEVLAAGIIMKTGWHGECDFADPMCGSGTFLIEAALIAGNINPGIYREHFAFEKWRDFDADLFEAIYNDDSAERDINCAILGGDIDPEAVVIARRNIKAAHLDSNISLVCRPMQEWDENDRDGIIVTNPPYGERLRPDDMEGLYRQIGETLKKHFQGWHAWILGYKDEHFASIGLKPSVKYPILNGALECSLREYVLFNGSYNDFRADGGSVSNKTFKRENRVKPHRISDEEWNKDKKDSRKNFKKDSRRDERRKEDFHREHLNSNNFDNDDFGSDNFRRNDRRRDERPRDDFRKGNGKDFRKSDRNDFRKGEGKDFRKGDRNDFSKGEGKDFRKGNRNDFHKGDSKDFNKSKSPYKVIDRGPSISEDYTTISNPVIMRSRKHRRDSDTED